MASIISAGTTSGTALNMAGDTSGVLQLATNGSTTALTINTSQKVLVNTTTARANFQNSPTSPQLQLEGTDAATSIISSTRNSADTGGPRLMFGKSRGATIGSNTIVQNGDNVGQIAFEGNDGAEFVDAASITAIIDGTPGANDMPGALLFNTTADGAASPTERMRITSAGLLQFDSGYGSVATAYGCRAWINFDGTGTPAIRASGNVSSITDNGTGDYSLNFTNAMPDANYGIAGAGGSGNADVRVLVGQGLSQTSTTGSCRIGTSNSANAVLTDYTRVYVAIFR